MKPRPHGQHDLSLHYLNGPPWLIYIGNLQAGSQICTSMWARRGKG